MGKSVGNTCAVKICSSRKYNDNCRSLRFFRFPKPIDADRMMKWRLACGNDNVMQMDSMKLYNTQRVCSLHFEQHMMINRNLKEDAVPTLNLKEVLSSAAVLEDHAYFRDENIEVGHYMEIEDIVIKETTRSIGTQTEEIKFNVGTQTCEIKVNVGTQTHYIDKMDCQVQTEKCLSAKTPRKLKLFQKIKDQNESLQKVVKQKAKLQLSYEKEVSLKLMGVFFQIFVSALVGYHCYQLMVGYPVHLQTTPLY